VILHNPFGPIFEKELRATSRRKRTYALRFVYLAGLLLFLVMVYVSSSPWGSGATSVTQRVQQQNRLGREFFMCFSLFCVGSMAIIGPVLTCTAISAERLHKTLHVLLMTPITAWQIVTGKLFSRLLVALTLIGLSLPVLALVRLLGGVELTQMFGVITLATTVALTGAAVGLFVSTFVNRAYAAILLGYAALLLVWVFVPILILVTLASRGPPPMGVFRTVCTISPLFSTAFLAEPSGGLGISPWGRCVAIQLALASALVVWSALVLRRIQRREGSGRQLDGNMPAEAGTPNDLTDAVELPGVRPNPFRQVHWRARMRSDVGDNPVLWRELGRRLFPRKWQARTVGIGFVALLLISYACFESADVLGERFLQIPYAIGFNGLAWLLLCVLSGTAIAQEKESDTWTLLLATPVGGRDIVIGKILGIYRRLLWPAVLVAAHFTLFALSGVISWVAAFYVLWLIVTCNTIWVATGLYLSLRLRRVTFAVILNLMIGIVLYLGGAIVIAIACELLSQLAGIDVDRAERLLWGLPYFVMGMGVERFSPEFQPGQTFHAPGGGPMTHAQMFWLGLGIGAAHVLAAGTLVWWTVKRFNTLVGRAEQHEPLPPPAPLLNQPLAAG
jgi:ABC-type transport system involved in multi-copper enzyme maturation permease subunit